MQTSETTGSAPPPPSAPFAMTESAATRINRLSADEGKKLRFRVSVKGGGCSGFQYEFGKGDTVIAHSGAEVVVDDVSLGILNGSVLDYTEDLAQAGFSIKNPNATARCGCGNSFSVSL